MRLATTTLPDIPPPWTAAVWVKRETDSDGATLWSSNSHAIKLEQWGNTHQVGITAFGQFDRSSDAVSRGSRFQKEHESGYSQSQALLALR